MPTHSSLISMMLIIGIGGLTAAEASPLAGHSFTIFHPTADGGSHRCSLRFDRESASSDMFPDGSIPASGTLQTKKQGRRKTVISEFSAKGEEPWGKGSVSFTASKDGDGAKGSVILTQPGKDPVTIAFTGADPRKK